MTPRRLLALLASLVILALACGPAAAPDSGAPAIGPFAQGDTPAEPPKPTSTPDPYPTKPNPIPSTPVPTKPPTADQPPAATPFPAHPEGLEGCKSVAVFKYEADVEHQGWCAEQLTQHVRNTCQQEPTEAEQRQCGEDIVQEYRSVLYRYGASRCAGMRSGSSAKLECVHRSSEDLEKGLVSMFEAWDKVRIGGNRDPNVVTAMKDVVTCLEGRGFEDIDQGLLFVWQGAESPGDMKAGEGQLSVTEKSLAADLLEPSIDCGKQHGLFDAQDVAWVTELRRLDKEEPETVADLIREGLMEALDKPGTAAFLAGDMPW